MSADNWALCPRCKSKVEAEYDAQIQSVANAYGKVSPDEYLSLRDGVKNGPNLESAHSFREDYELGVLPDGEFYVIYRGGCTSCGLVFEYKHQAKLDLASAPEVAKPTGRRK